MQGSETLNIHMSGASTGLLINLQGTSLSLISAKKLLPKRAFLLQETPLGLEEHYECCHNVKMYAVLYTSVSDL